MKRILVCCFLAALAAGPAGCGDSKDGKDPKLANPDQKAGNVQPAGPSGGGGKGNVQQKAAAD